MFQNFRNLHERLDMIKKKLIKNFCFLFVGVTLFCTFNNFLLELIQFFIKKQFKIHYNVDSFQIDKTIFANISCDLIENDQKTYLHHLKPLCKTTLQNEISAFVLTEYAETFLSSVNNLGLIEKAFVSFVSGHYKYLTTVALEATVRFSRDIPVLLYVTPDINDAASMWPVKKFPNLIVFQMPNSILSVYFNKIRAALLSPVLSGFIIESDTLITPHITRVFSLLSYHSDPLPILVDHPDVRLPDCTQYNGPKSCINSFSYPANLRSVEYMHAHMGWNFNAKYFFSSLIINCLNGGDYCDNDEHALNERLWNVSAKNVFCILDPHYSFVNDWKNQTKNLNGLHMVSFMIVHGCKDPEKAKELLNDIESMKKKPWIWYNNEWRNSPDNISINELSCLL